MAIEKCIEPVTATKREGLLKTEGRGSAVDLVKVFSATMFADRAVIGERATEWLRGQLPTHEIAECIVTQSSDAQFHCITLTFFMRRRG